MGPDVVGVAKGVSYGSAFRFEYKILVPFKDKMIISNNIGSKIRINYTESKNISRIFINKFFNII